MSFDKLPGELRALNQWLCWRYEDIPNNKPTKVPYNPRTGYPASVTDPQAWSTFEACCSAVATSQGRYSGIGFVFTNRDPYAGIDLDYLHDDVEGTARQERIFVAMDSYSERSPSGMGLHIIVKAEVPHGRKRHGIEVYSSGRFFTMTGDVFKDAPIADRQTLVNVLWSEMGVSAEPNYYAGDFTQHHSDTDVWDQAAKAKNGDLFTRLWAGDTSGYFSASEADFALIDIIAFYTKQREQIKRMFMSSELGKREKYASANPGRLSTLIGYMVNKSFDRMLPPVDISGLIDEFNAAQAQRALPPEAEVHRPALSADQAPATPAPHSFDGFDTTVWQRHGPPGVLGMLADYIYRSAPRPVYEIALAGALGLMSGIVGRAFNVSGTGLNHYIMCLAPTGTGKEAMASGIERLLSAVEVDFPSVTQFIGPSEIASGQALLKHLSDRPTPCFVTITGEFGLRLQQISSPNASSSEVALRRALLDLFNKSGAGEKARQTIYSDKKNNTDVIHSPAFSMIGESTPEVFYRALDEDSVTQGLLPRFTIIEYTGPRVPLNEGRKGMEVPMPLVKAITDLARICHDNMNAGRVTVIETTPEADVMLRKIDVYGDAKINGVEKDALRQLWNRLHVKTLKMAGLLAVASNFYQPRIDAMCVEWALSLVMSDTVRLLTKFVTGDMGTNEGKQQETALIGVIADYLNRPAHELKNYGVREDMHGDKVVPYTYLHRRLSQFAAFRNDRRGSTVALKASIQNLVEMGTIIEFPIPQSREKYKTAGKAFAPADMRAFV